MKNRTGSIEKLKSTIYPRIVTTLQHMLLLTETKRSCAHMLLMTAQLLDKRASINCVVCKLKKSMPSDLQSQLLVTRKATQQFTVRLYLSNLVCLTSIIYHRLSEARLCTHIQHASVLKISQVSARNTCVRLYCSQLATMCSQLRYIYEFSLVKTQLKIPVAKDAHFTVAAMWLNIKLLIAFTQSHLSDPQKE